MKWLLGTLSTVVGLAAALLVSAWFWSASPQSLAQALQWASDWLADGEQRPLQVEGVTGDLRRGGTLTRLRWAQDGLTVELLDLTLRWPATAWADVLLHRRLVLETLTVARVAVSDERPPRPEPALQAPTHLQLPWLQAVALALQVDRLQWRTGTQDAPQLLGPLQARYTYGPLADGPPQDAWHRLQVDTLHWQGGRYQLQAQVQATAAMQLQATLNGELQTAYPGGSGPLPLQAQASLQGTLAGDEAALQLQLSVQGRPGQRTASPQPRLQADLTLWPWAAWPLRQADLSLDHLDLARLWPGAPRTRLHGRWQVHSAAGAQGLASADWRIDGTLRNDLPGPWDRQQLPLSRLTLDLQGVAGQWQLHALQAEMAGGEWQAAGHAQVQDGLLQAWQGQLQAKGIRGAALFSTLPLQATDLRLTARHEAPSPTGPTAVELRLQPSGPAAGPRELPAPNGHLLGRWQAGRLQLTELSLQVLDAALQADGQLHTDRPGFDGQARLRLPGLNLAFDGHAVAPGALPQRPSQARLDLQDAPALHRWLRQTVALITPVWPATGTASAVLAQLQDLQLEGRARADAQWGALPSLAGPAGRNVTAPWSLQLQTAQLRVQHSGTQAARDLRLNDWQVTLQGEGTDWRLQHSGQTAAHHPDPLQRWQLQGRLALSGQWQPSASAPVLSAQVHTLTMQARHGAQPLGLALEVSGAPVLQRQAEGDWVLQPGQLQVRPLAATDRTLPPMADQPMALSWSMVRWAQGQLSSQGRWQGLALSWLNAWLSSDSAPKGLLQQAGLGGDLWLDGQWDLALPITATAGPTAAPPRARLQVQRGSGELTLLALQGPGQAPVRAGVQALTLQLQLQGEQLQGQARWASEQAGQWQAEWRTTLAAPGPGRPQWQWPAQAPLSGQLQARLPQIGLWSSLTPTGWRISGGLQADASLSGTREQPQWQGQLQLRDLALRSLLDGLDFSDGQLQATLAGETLTIDRLQLRGAGGASGGLLSGSGNASWPRVTGPEGVRREPRIDLRLQAERLRLPARADRRLAVSGDLRATLQGQQLTLGGRLHTDQALFVLPDENTPTLSRDVVVRGTERPPGFATGLPIRLQIGLEVDLGEDFHLRGPGLDTYLSGRLQVTATPTKPTPQVTGQVQTVRGSYRAFGQTLQIEQGQLLFNGPVDNPALDILALRPHPTQRVGVAIDGSAQAPRVRLYADPDLPDSEKLAWLVLGRPATGAGTEAAVLQQAALALVSGSGSSRDASLARALGLDELSLQGQVTNADGSTSAPAITLGKRISNQLYVSYSRSVVGAVGKVAVFYDISRFLTLRAQAGEDNAIDLIFSHSFDGQALPPRTIGPASP